jgi:Glutamate-cysteine ligase
MCSLQTLSLTLLQLHVTYYCCYCYCYCHNCRTEFRSLEVQLTDFENAAFVVFIVLVTRVILAFDLNLYVPLSKVDENMRRAHARDAVHTQKFAFRTSIDPPAADGPTQPASDQVSLLLFIVVVQCMHYRTLYGTLLL